MLLPGNQSLRPVLTWMALAVFLRVVLSPLKVVLWGGPAALLHVDMVLGQMRGGIVIGVATLAPAIALWPFVAKRFPALERRPALTAVVFGSAATLLGLATPHPGGVDGWLQVVGGTVVNALAILAPRWLHKDLRAGTFEEGWEHGAVPYVLSWTAWLNLASPYFAPLLAFPLLLLAGDVRAWLAGAPILLVGALAALPFALSARRWLRELEPTARRAALPGVLAAASWLVYLSLSSVAGAAGGSFRFLYTGRLGFLSPWLAIPAVAVGGVWLSRWLRDLATRDETFAEPAPRG